MYNFHDEVTISFNCNMAETVFSSDSISCTKVKIRIRHLLTSDI